MKVQFKNDFNRSSRLQTAKLRIKSYKIGKWGLWLFLSSFLYLMVTLLEPSLLNAQDKYQEDLNQTKIILSKAKAAKNDQLWAESLIKATNLQIDFGGYETAVRFLKEQEWPTDPLARSFLYLYQGQALMVYHRQYSWEISQREKTLSKDPLDLKTLTREQIAFQIRDTFDSIMNYNKILNKSIPVAMKAYLEGGNYPLEVKPVLRDDVVNLAVEHLLDTTFWSPKELNEVSQFSFENLVLIKYKNQVLAKDEKKHPLQTAIAWLLDHAQFHLNHERTQAVLEVRYSILEILYRHLKGEKDRSLIREELKKIQKKERNNPWWSRGQALLANFVREKLSSDRLIEALAIAKEGMSAYPGTVGAQMCEALVSEIEASRFTAESMAVDGLNKKSIQITYKNVDKHHFRAYSIDVKKDLSLYKGHYNFGPGSDSSFKNKILEKPFSQWSVDLEKTKDYDFHRALLTPQLSKAGYYWIYISYNSKFDEKNNKIQVIPFLVSDLVFIEQIQLNNTIEGRLINGSTGEAQKGVKVSLYKYSYEDSATVVSSEETDEQGYVVFKKPTHLLKKYYEYFLVAQKDNQYAFNLDNINFSSEYSTKNEKSSFVMTDRSVYRPGQKILWKIITYEGNSREGKFKVISKGKEVVVKLKDPNSQVVQTSKIKTNEFGTLSGEFTIPSGRPLGSWYIETNLNGYGNIRVEEYKRPTFEVELLEAKTPLCLNKKATIEGQARYYFGQALNHGKIKWKVSRQEAHSWWWERPTWGGGSSHFSGKNFSGKKGFPGRHYGLNYNSAEKQILETGLADLKEDGTFQIEFLPEADERRAEEKGLYFNYLVEVDLTEEGGETRSFSKEYKIGFTTLETDLNFNKPFYDIKSPVGMNFLLRQLDGKRRSGTATYRLVRLKQDEKTKLPAELPYEGSSDGNQSGASYDGYGSDGNGMGGSFREGGGPGNIYSNLENLLTQANVKNSKSFLNSDDLKRPRFDTQFDWKKIVARWPEGETLDKGSLKHNEQGVASLEMKALEKAGAYRLHYEIKDDYGKTLKVYKDFIVTKSKTQLALPFILIPEKESVLVGEKARFFIHSGWEGQRITIEIYKKSKRSFRKELTVGTQDSIIEIPITLEDRGGFSISAYTIKDYQLMRASANILVPWNDKSLQMEFSSFRDKIRPGSKEKFTLKVKDYKGKELESGAAEILAMMYDCSLDFFSPHALLSLLTPYPSNLGFVEFQSNLKQIWAKYLVDDLEKSYSWDLLTDNQLQILSNDSIGGPGYGKSDRSAPRGEFFDSMKAQDISEIAKMPSLAGGAAPMEKKKANKIGLVSDGSSKLKEEMPSQESSGGGAAARAGNENAERKGNGNRNAEGEKEGDKFRQNFSETAFFKPHLISEPNGQVTIEFEVPDSVTSWKLIAQALTKDLRGGEMQAQLQSVKELMVRPALPRFLREGDEAEIKVNINNTSEVEMSGDLTFDIQVLEDANSANDKNKSVLTLFGLSEGLAKKTFKVPKKGSLVLAFPIKVPKKIGMFSFKVIGKTKSYSDGEIRALPVLPSRMHLAQSRFVTLKNQANKTLEFKDLAEAKQDPTLINEKMVVTLDTQLFYNVLQSLPYLIKYPYECAEQTLNRFLSTGILTSLYRKYPAISKMAKDFSSRKTQFEKFDEPDANLKMSLEEAPWLQDAQGGAEIDKDQNLVNVLDERKTRAEQERALTRLKKMQLSNGAFPWFEGGQPDEYITLYLLMGFAKALEFKIEVPKEMTQKAWQYIRTNLDNQLTKMMSMNCCWENITLINYALSSYPDESWTGNLFNTAYRKKILDFSFTHWRKHSPLLKGYLALTLKRTERAADAKLVWDSVMDSTKTTEELGTFWAPEDRSWLWYNDTIETHAFSLRTLMELNQKDSRNEGMVQWLFLNKKLNHWKSTKATAEVIYSLAKYLESIAGLGQKEIINVNMGTQNKQFVFEPDKYTGKKTQLLIAGDKIDPKLNSKIVISKETAGFAFASATWHFSTDKLPKEGSSDFFSVSRKYFLRENKGKESVLRPISDGAKIRVGDQIEVQITLKTKHQAQYVHLRDPRAAGLEPENALSGHKWNLGITWFEEIRDSGSNFFFDTLPVGEYPFKYRLRANMAGTFKVGPATVQSMYAPEFNAYSEGSVLKVIP